MKKIIPSFSATLFFTLAFASLALPQVLTVQDDSKISQEDTYETLGTKIGNFSFIDQDGNPFQLEEYFGKPFVITFFYTNCPVICPALLLRLKEVATEAKEGFGRDFRILAVGFDVENDTPEMLNSWGKNFTESFENWKFVTTENVEKMRKFVKQFGFKYKKIKLGYDHLIVTSVVGKGGTIMAHVFGDDYDPKEVLAALKFTSPQKPDLPLLSHGGWTLLTSILAALAIFSLLLYLFVLTPLKEKKSH